MWVVLPMDLRFWAPNGVHLRLNLAMACTKRSSSDWWAPCWVEGESVAECVCLMAAGASGFSTSFVVEFSEVEKEGCSHAPSSPP